MICCQCFIAQKEITLKVIPTVLFHYMAMLWILLHLKWWLHSYCHWCGRAFNLSFQKCQNPVLLCQSCKQFSRLLAGNDCERVESVWERNAITTSPIAPILPLPVLLYPIMHCRNWEKSTTNSRGRNRRIWRWTSTPSHHKTGTPQNYKSLGTLCIFMILINRSNKLQLFSRSRFPPGCRRRMRACPRRGGMMVWEELPLLLRPSPGWAESA